MRRFLAAEAVWAAGILAVLAGVGLAGGDSTAGGQLVRWLARALELAAFPAGIAAASLMLNRERPWSGIVPAVAAAAVVGFAVTVLLLGIAPAEATGGDWESVNHAAWARYTPYLAGLTAMLYAAIGGQVGMWASYSMPPSLRRPLCWAVGLGLLVSGFAVFDTTYETFVLHTHADASPAAFYTVLVPLSICAGLGLPTLGLVRHGGKLQT